MWWATHSAARDLLASLCMNIRALTRSMSPDEPNRSPALNRVKSRLVFPAVFTKMPGSAITTTCSSTRYRQQYSVTARIEWAMIAPLEYAKTSSAAVSGTRFTIRHHNKGTMPVHKDPTSAMPPFSPNTWRQHPHLAGNIYPPFPQSKPPLDKARVRFKAEVSSCSQS